MDTVVEDEDACEVVERDFQGYAIGDIELVWGETVGDCDDEGLCEATEPEGEEARGDDDGGLDCAVLC